MIDYLCQFDLISLLLSVCPLWQKCLGGQKPGAPQVDYQPSAFYKCAQRLEEGEKKISILVFLFPKQPNLAAASLCMYGECGVGYNGEIPSTNSAE